MHFTDELTGLNSLTKNVLGITSTLSGIDCPPPVLLCIYSEILGKFLSGVFLCNLIHLQRLATS